MISCMLTQTNMLDYKMPYKHDLFRNIKATYTVQKLNRNALFLLILFFYKP